jgi:transposase-like protein
LTACADQTTQHSAPYSPRVIENVRFLERGQQRSNALLLPDQDHRNIKSRVNAMLGFNSFRNAAVTISGIELIAKLSPISRTCASKVPLRPPFGGQSFPLAEVAANTSFFARR